jgi:hypothetical protein
MLDQILTVLVVILPTLFAVLLEAVSKEIKEHPYWRIGVLTFGIGLSALTWIQISRADRIHDNEQKELEGKLDQSLLAQQYTKGQLESLSLTVGQCNQSSPQLAVAIKQMAQANAQNASDLKASNAELCKRTYTKAEDIRRFQAKYESDRQAVEMQDLAKQRAATTDQASRELLNNMRQRDWMSQQSHDLEFRSKYMPGAKYLRDLLMSRIPPKMSETLVNNNGQAEMNLAFSTFSGNANEYGIATYLDELANAVCPGEQTKAKKAN